MATAVFKGTTEQELTNVILEQFNPGDRVDLRLGVTRQLSADEMQDYTDYLADNGVEDVVTEQVSDPWSNTVRVQFTRPHRIEGYGVTLGVVGIILGGLLAIGLLGLIGWGVTKFVDAVTKNIVPIIAVCIGGFLIYNYQRTHAYK